MGLGWKEEFAEQGVERRGHGNTSADLWWGVGGGEATDRDVAAGGENSEVGSDGDYWGTCSGIEGVLSIFVGGDGTDDGGAGERKR